MQSCQGGEGADRQRRASVHAGLGGTLASAAAATTNMRMITEKERQPTPGRNRGGRGTVSLPGRYRGGALPRGGGTVALRGCCCYSLAVAARVLEGRTRVAVACANGYL